MENKAEIIRKAKILTEGLGMGRYCIAIIMIALNRNWDVTPLIEVRTFPKMKVVFEGLRANIDVNLYAKRDYSLGKMKIIKDALINNIEVKDILKTEKFISEESLSFIVDLRKMDKEDGPFADETHPVERFIRDYLPLQVTSDRLKLLYEAYKEGVSETITLNKTASNSLIATALMAKKRGYDFDLIAKQDFMDSQLSELRQAMDEKVDITLMLNSDFSSLQLRQIRLGLVNGVDVATYADPKISPLDMKEMRSKLALNASEELYNQSYDLAKKLLR